MPADCLQVLLERPTVSMPQAKVPLNAEELFVRCG